jgi:hypothetical protein
MEDKDEKHRNQMGLLISLIVMVLSVGEWFGD